MRDFGLRDVNSDLTTTDVLRVALVGLNAALSRPGHDSTDAERALVIRGIDPSDVDQTIVDSCKGIHDHASVAVLAIVDHHEGGVNATLLDRFVIDRQLILVLHETTCESLQVCGDRVRAGTAASLPGVCSICDFSWH